MFDIGFLELMLIGIVGLLVLGPERLPKAARTTGLWIGKIKRSVSGMQREINAQLEAEELRQKLAEQQKKLDAGLDKARRDVESYAGAAPREDESSPKKADNVNPGQPGATQQAEHEPVEPSTPATDADSNNASNDVVSNAAEAPSGTDRADASSASGAGDSSADKDSASR
ncbi:sec-independent protein translocase protein TatB [Modicisalibacter muralis]|uniref:Sec-independent protein translocase protein TatB n=1 Tax=Modicisalibacter muralis TaxID=119000 RepID=A0A1G9R4I9_9GAMM|nr:Sec-independent protein translocase protein TatB [Halomonas muralis]SDM17345.1 sec-independent protein translocase protein TatB [Halomonas muralis]